MGFNLQTVLSVTVGLDRGSFSSYLIIRIGFWAHHTTNITRDPLANSAPIEDSFKKCNNGSLGLLEFQTSASCPFAHRVLGSKRASYDNYRAPKRFKNHKVGGISHRLLFK